jgi:hypothetical protein
MSVLHRLLSISLFILLAACAQSVSTDVTRFNQFAGPPMGTFSIEPAPEQAGSLEFTSTVTLLSAELRRIGFAPAATGDAADYVVRYTATQTRFDAGSERGPVDVGVGVGGGSRGTSVGVGIGFNLGSGGNSSAGYINKLSVTMERPDGARVFEGHASAMSHSQGLNDIMPYLMRAVFTDFPGENGASRTMNVKLDK